MDLVTIMNIISIISLIIGVFMFVIALLYNSKFIKKYHAYRLQKTVEKINKRFKDCPEINEYEK